MIGSCIVFFIVTSIVVIVFTFNVPYWMGKEMGEFSGSPIWKWMHCLISGIGFLFGVIIEGFSTGVIDGVRSLIPRRPERFRRLAITTLSFSLTLLLILGLAYLYETVSYALLDSDLSGYIEVNSSEYAKLVDVLFVVNIFIEAESITGILDVLNLIVYSAWILLLRLVVSFLYFSVVFGFLEHRVNELQIGDTLRSWFSKSNDTEVTEEEDTEESKPRSFKELAIAVKDALLDFLNSQAILKHFTSKGFVLLFLIGTAIYSVFAVRAGKSLDFFELLINTLFEAGVVDLVCSFLVSFIFMKLGLTVTKKIVAALPTPLQEVIRNLEQQCEQWYKKMKESRARHCEDDAEDAGSPMHKGRVVSKMTLFGNGD